MSNVIGQDMVNRLYDCQVVDPRGEKIGAVKRVWLDSRTGEPLWASVHTGLFGRTESFVPLQRAEFLDDRLRVPVDKEQVKDSPRIEAGHDQMTDEEQAALYRHYGFGPQSRGPDLERRPPRIRRPGSTQEQVDYQNPRLRDGARATAGTDQPAAGSVRLVKHVATDDQRIAVPSAREEANQTRHPAGNRTGTPARRDDTHARRDDTQLVCEPVVDRAGSGRARPEEVRLAGETAVAPAGGGRTRRDETRLTHEPAGNPAGGAHARRDEARLVHEPVGNPAGGAHARRDEVRLVHETVGDRAGGGQVRREAPVFAEKTLMTRGTVPVERVRREAETDTETVAGTVREEEGAVKGGRRKRPRRR